MDLSGGGETGGGEVRVTIEETRGLEDMVFRRRRTRNLQTMSTDVVLSVTVGVQKICWPGARPFEVSDWETSVFTNKEARTEGRILLRTRACTSNEMEEDVIVGVLLAFMVGNSVPRDPGVDFRWCPLTKRIGLSVCVNGCHVTSVTVQLNETGSSL